MRRLILIAALAVIGSCASGADAAIVTVGPPLDQAEQAKGGFGAAPILYANTSLPAGLNVTSPVNGRVIRWRINQTVGGPFRLRVLRPGGNLIYTTLGVSDPVNSPSPAQQTFPTTIPIQAGDTIGLEVIEPADDQAGFLLTEDPMLAFTFWSPRPPDGVPTKGEFPDTGEGIALNADIQPVPAMTAISPASGNIRGGTTVTLAGTDFIGASSVVIGEKPVTSFSVDSEQRITAVTAGVSNPGPVQISVTTPGGSTTGGPQFTYEACSVPKLKGKNLKRVRKRLRSSNCKLGKVKRSGGANGTTGRVVGQRPPPGRFKPPGTKVRVTLG